AQTGKEKPDNTNNDAGKTTRSGQREKRSAIGRGKVGGQLDDKNTAQSQLVSNLEDKPVGQDNNAVIRTTPKKRKTSPPAGKQNHPENSQQQVITHGQ